MLLFPDFSMWALVVSALSLASSALVLKVRQALAPYSPALLRLLDAVSWGLDLAGKYAYFRPLTEQFQAARKTSWLMEEYVRRELPVLGVAPAAVEWLYSDDNKANRNPYVRCRVTENGEACRALAQVRRFSIGGDECHLIRDPAQFPTHLCARHIRLLPELYPALSANVRPAPSSRFVRQVPEVSGYTTLD